MESESKSKSQVNAFLLHYVDKDTEKKHLMSIIWTLAMLSSAMCDLLTCELKKGSCQYN